MKTRRPIVVLPLIVNVAYATALVILAATPSIPEAGRNVPDYWAHGLGYGMQAALAYWLVWPLFSRLGAIVISWFAASILGCGTELMQATISYRSAQLTDAVADMVGAAAIMCALIIVRRLINGARQFAGPRSAFGELR